LIGAFGVAVEKAARCTRAASLGALLRQFSIIQNDAMIYDGGAEASVANIKSVTLYSVHKLQKVLKAGLWAESLQPKTVAPPANNR
jgi:hypothetical protein